MLDPGIDAAEGHDAVDPITALFHEERFMTTEDKKERHVVKNCTTTYRHLLLLLYNWLLDRGSLVSLALRNQLHYTIRLHSKLELHETVLSSKHITLCHVRLI